MIIVMNNSTVSEFRDDNTSDDDDTEMIRKLYESSQNKNLILNFVKKNG